MTEEFNKNGTLKRECVEEADEMMMDCDDGVQYCVNAVVSSLNH